MLPVQQEVQGLVPCIQTITLENIQISAEISRKEEELKNSELYQDINSLKQILKKNEQMESDLREKGKMLMLENGLKELEMIDGTVIQLSKTPGSLKIASEENIPDSFYRIKREVDKVALKKAFLAGECLDPNITVESEYKFTIKSK